jgi:hypothetical protein
LVISARCGWFGGHAGCSDTLPAMPASSRATNHNRARVGALERPLPPFARCIDGERAHEADAGPAVDGVGEELCELVEIRG